MSAKNKDESRTISPCAKIVAAMCCVAVLNGCALSGAQAIGFQGQVDVAQRMLLSGQYDGAYKILDQVAENNQSQAPAQLSIGNAYMRGGAFFKAKNAFHESIKMGKELEGHLGLGRVALAQNDTSKAFQMFDLVLAQDPTNEVALNGRGVAFDLLGKHQSAVAEYTKLLSFNPTNIDALNNLALSHAIGGASDQAVSILRELTQSQLTDMNLQHNLAIAYFVAGQKDTAYTLATAELSKDEAQKIFQSVINYRRR